MSPASPWEGRAVFVTGSSGFLGSWLAEALLERGAHVVGLVRDEQPAVGLRPYTRQASIQTVRGSLEDVLLLERSLNEYAIDTVFHVAAQALVTVANRNPLSTFEANVRGTWNLLEACRRNPLVKRIVLASSDKAYGAHDTLPYLEDLPLRGRHPYDVSKSCADLIATAYHSTYGLPVCVTRCGNLFGGGDLNFDRLVPGTVRSLLRGERPLIRSDGKMVRDYVFVQDAAHAYLLLAERMEDATLHGQAFNFGLEAPVSVLDLTQRLIRMVGREDLRPIVLDEARAEIQTQYLSAAKARRVLQWAPTHDLDGGLEQTIAWYRAYFALAAAGPAREG